MSAFAIAPRLVTRARQSLRCSNRFCYLLRMVLRSPSIWCYCRRKSYAVRNQRRIAGCRSPERRRGYRLLINPGNCKACRTDLVGGGSDASVGSSSLYYLHLSSFRPLHCDIAQQSCCSVTLGYLVAVQLQPTSVKIYQSEVLARQCHEILGTSGNLLSDFTEILPGKFLSWGIGQQIVALF